MFERYTESARRVLFFARYEASELGEMAIETHHLLLGVLRERKGVTAGVLDLGHISADDIRADVESRTSVFREKLSRSVEIPFTEETQRVLQFSAEEADRLEHGYIGTEHLLLGLLREPGCAAAAILGGRGVTLGSARAEVAKLSGSPESYAPNIREALAQLRTIERLVQLLATVPAGTPEAQEVADKIRYEIDALTRHFIA
jgi:ATP-dependent Clp protease ATP-binding subunit ClpC